MHITIAERLRPYAHIPGTPCPLPGTNRHFKIFPTLLRVYDGKQIMPKLLAELLINVKGPVQDFTVQLDLEKASIRVWGNSQDGYFRFRIVAMTNGFTICIEKNISNGLKFIPLSNLYSMEVQDSKIIFTEVNAPEFYHTSEIERLSLGNHKAQDWSQVKQRLNFTEILPIWFRLGQLVPPNQTECKEGTAELLQQCQHAVKEKKITEVIPLLGNLFLAGFEGLLVPRLLDLDYQGFDLSIPGPTASPMVLLSQGAKLIRSLFIQESLNDIAILPVLPPEFHCGRLLHLRCSKGFLDLEWSKKNLRRMILCAEKSGSISFLFQKELQRYRIQEEGKVGKFLTVDNKLMVEAGKTYTFDRFEK